MTGGQTKLVPDSQLILDAPLFKVPLELLRRNFKSAQRNIDKETKAITATINEATHKTQLGKTTPEETLASLDLMIKRMQTLKRKVSLFLLSTLFANGQIVGRSTSRRGVMATSFQVTSQTYITAVLVSNT